MFVAVLCLSTTTTHAHAQTVNSVGVGVGVGLQLLVSLLIVIACAIAARDLWAGVGSFSFASCITVNHRHPRQGRGDPASRTVLILASGWLQRRPIHSGSRPAKMHVPGCIASVTALSFPKTGAAPCGTPQVPCRRQCVLACCRRRNGLPTEAGAARRGSRYCVFQVTV
jgi:hypothetical protein